jgi:hypothetical protein
MMTQAAEGQSPWPGGGQPLHFRNVPWTQYENSAKVGGPQKTSANRKSAKFADFNNLLDLRTFHKCVALRTFHKCVALRNCDLWTQSFL